MCTSFAVYHQEKAVYGMNFDTDDIDLKLKISSYNDMNLFYFSALLENKYRDIAYPRNPLFPALGLHTMIADKTGDAFILEEGNGTNIISPVRNDFIVMTNFPNGKFEETKYNEVYGLGADRYICAYEYIRNNIHSFGINEAFEILNKTSQKNTLCTIVYEPIKNEIYISFKKDLSKKWKISVTDKTIQSMDGFLSNNKIQLTNDEVLVNDLISLYK